MENWKNKVGNIFQKVNTAGKTFLSTILPETQEKQPEMDSSLPHTGLNFLRSRYQIEEVEDNLCSDCERNFGILTIGDDYEYDNNCDVQRKNDREEIRRKLAMDSDTEDYIAEKNVQAQNSTSIDRLKGGSNLQICFMNEAANECEVPKPEPEFPASTTDMKKPVPRFLKSTLLSPPVLQKSAMGTKIQNNNNTPQVTKRQRPTFFFNRPRSWHAAKPEVGKPDPEEDLFTRHRRLQAEAREALAQAKDMARMQMEIERQKKKKSPIADIVGMSFPDGHNLLSRTALLDMNVAQLQVIVNDLHSQIETLNEDLVKFLLERDDLHMEQDSMLVDIEDLTRYLGLKGNNSAHSSDTKLHTNMLCHASNK